MDIEKLIRSLPKTPVEKPITISSHHGEGQTSNISRIMAPSLKLDPNGSYSIALTGAAIWYMFWNVSDILKNNVIRFRIKGTYRNITIPNGTYQMDGLNLAINRGFQDLVDKTVVQEDDVFYTTATGKKVPRFLFSANINTARLEIVIVDDDHPVDNANRFAFDLLNSPYNNINELLGFKLQLHTQNTSALTTANFEREISTVNINCNLISESYVNGAMSSLLFSFPLAALPGTLMSIQPTHPIHIPINVSEISEIRIWLTDNLERPIICGNKDDEEPVVYTIVLRREA